MCFRWKKRKRKVRYAWFIRVQPWHQHCPTGISFLLALKWFENPSCIILFKHISHVDSWYIMYDCVHQLCNAIQAMTIYYLFDSQSRTLFNPKLFLSLLLSPNSFIFCWPVLLFYTSTCHVSALSILCINASRGCHECFFCPGQKANS